jgi:cyclophilin family peptidyl-prolyl cis-trans isomerase
MNRFVLAALFVPCFACSSSTTAVLPGPDGAAPNDSGQPPVDGGGGDGNALYLPAGYSLVPFLTDTATTHKYTKADQVLDPSKDYVAVIDTDVGRIVMHLLSTDAPIAVNSFVFLSLHHYFDGILFHRVIDGFMAQTGDPNTLMANQSSWGTGGPGYFFGLEKNSFSFDGAGVVGMANTGQPNSNGSQFFITFAPATFLDGMYTIWAKVIEGLDVLPKIVRGEIGKTPFPPGGPSKMLDVYIGAK